MTNTSVFDFKDYKPYLKHCAGGDRQRSGFKSAMARAAKCQTTYVSRVLNGGADFSLEQAEAISGLQAHTDEESHYFLLLVQRARAGTQTLKKYFEKQIDQILKRRMTLRERVASSSALSEADQAEYYSSWHYAALHIGITVPSLQTRDSLARHFRIPTQRAGRVLDYLVRVGLAREDGGRYVSTQSYLMLGNDSPNIIKHHSNWRNRAIDSLETERIDELHYSAIVSISRSDLSRIKENLLQVIQSNLSLFKESKEEDVFCCCMDFFNLSR